MNKETQNIEFKESWRDEYLKMTVTLENGGSFGGSVTSLSPVELTDRQKEICKMIKKNPRVSVKEMSLVLSLVERTIKRDLAAMQKMGVLVREGNTSAGHWVIIQK